MDTGYTQDLAEEVRGEVLGPDDGEYDAAREVWNARFDSRPDLIVRCLGEEDVSTAIRFCRDRGLPLTVKSGGHDYAGNSACDGGVLVDLSPLQAIEVMPEARRVRVQAGARWAQVDAATQRHGLATTGASVSTVGVAGFTLGGGEGWLSRTLGLGVDNLVRARVVTASGEVVTASAAENPDLFWAMRGGGGNFGIVTSFEFALHELGPDLLTGQVLYPLDRAPELLRFYRDYFLDAPDAVSCYPFILRIPPIPEFPEAHHGDLALDFVVAYAGSVEDAQPALAPFRDRGEPILDTVGRMPYVALQQSFDAGLPVGGRWYSRAHYFDTLTDGAIDTVLAGLDPFPGAFTIAYFGPSGGAVGRVDPGATAFPHRTATHALHILGGWTDPADDVAQMAWVRSLHTAVAPHANGGVYVNLLGEDESQRVPSAYGPNYARLAQLKAAWDPDNLFRRNHNIEPAS